MERGCPLRCLYAQNRIPQFARIQGAGIRSRKPTVRLTLTNPMLPKGWSIFKNVFNFEQTGQKQNGYFCCIHPQWWPLHLPTRLWATQPDLGRTGAIRECFASTPKAEPDQRDVKSKPSPPLENRPGANPRIPACRWQRQQWSNPLCSSGLRCSGLPCSCSGLRCSRERRPPWLRPPSATPARECRRSPLAGRPPWIILLGLCKGSGSSVDGGCWVSVWHG